MHSRVRQTVLTVVKLALAVAILSYLVIQGQDAIARLSERTIEWPLLGGALVCTLLTATLSFVRWHLLIRALGIDVRLLQTLQLGSLGFALNYVSLGSIGGDFFKAVFLAHGQPGRRTEAVATVVADRMLGLLTMLLLASAGIFVTGLLNATSPALKVLCRSILLITAATWTFFILLLFVEGFSGRRIRELVLKLRFSGRVLARLLGAVQVYRGQKPMLAAAFCASFAMALFFITSFYLVARALPIHEPPWTEHLVIVPIAGLVGAIPITPSGMGTMELAIEELYKTMPGGDAVVEGDGALVGIGRRATDMAVAVIGWIFYLTHRRQVREVYAEAEEVAEELDHDDTTSTTHD